MSLVWHIVRKDLRRLVAPLACWAFLLIAKGEVGVWVRGVDGWGGDPFFYAALVEYTLLAMEMVVAAVLVAELVQADGLVGSDEFWVTRPIGGGRLLAAKLISAGLMFGMLPLLVSLRWWWACGYGAAEMGRAAFALFDWQTMLVLDAMLFAALTRNLGQFLGALFAVSAVKFGAAYLGAVLAEIIQADTLRGVTETGHIVDAGLWVLGAVAALVVQFLTRRRRRALGIVVGAVGLATLGSAARWDFSGLWNRTPAFMPESADVTAALAETKFQTDAQGRRAVPIITRGMVEKFGVTATVDHVWSWKDGTQAHSFNFEINGAVPRAAEWQALGLGPAASEASRRSYGSEGAENPLLREGGLWLRPSPFLWGTVLERLDEEPAAYRGLVHATLWQPKLQWELPLKVGTQVRTAGRELRVVSANWQDGSLYLLLARGEPNWRRYARYRPALGGLLHRDDAPADVIVLVNRQRGEAIRLGDNVAKDSRLLVGTQELWMSNLRTAIPREADETSPEARPRWLDGATIVVLHYEPAGRLDREVTAPRFGERADNSSTK